MAHLDTLEQWENMQQPKLGFLHRIPPAFRLDFDDRVARENATRLVYAFVVGVISHISFLLIDLQRIREGIFEAQPVYRWIFYSRIVWWLMAWFPVLVVFNWKAIHAGRYPIRRFKEWLIVCIVWAWAFTLFRAAFNFQYNAALGFYAMVLVIVSVFILSFRFRFCLLLVSMIVMCVVVIQTDLSNSQMKYWLIAVSVITLLVFALSSVWYNNLVKQFLTEKSLDAQKHQLTEQAALLTEQTALLTEQNQVIEQDKALLANQLETSQRQLNAFALRLAKSANFLENIKSAIASINTLETEDAAKKKRLLRQIDQENDRENDWIHFREQFEQVHPNFFPALLAEFPTLSASDMRLLSLIKMNLETKEIADILSISPQSLNTARYRLRKNLGLTTEGLSEFVQKIR